MTKFWSKELAQNSTTSCFIIFMGRGGGLVFDGSFQVKDLTSRLEEVQVSILAREETIERLSGKISEMEVEKELRDSAHEAICEELACSKANMLALERDLSHQLEEAQMDIEMMAGRIREVKILTFFLMDILFHAGT